jgi:AhpD family alkylhydroperoxidase
MMTSQTTEIPVRLDFDGRAPSFSAAMNRLDAAATKELDRVGFDARLRELVRLRASQLNGCAYCVNMHSADARAAGETDQRLALLAVWRETALFDERERAALALTEAITCVAETHVPETAWEGASAHFSPDELGALVSLVVTINAWNAIGVSTRAWPVSST